ncbi:MAG TPA: hypothetical protein VIY86_05810, partial [Pirellulaceae bacterium]
ATGATSLAEAEAQRALQLVSDHPHALTVRGSVAALAPGTNDNLQQALADFELALAGAADNYLAALGRARTLERLERYSEAADAFEYILERLSPAGPDLAGDVLTSTQRQTALEGRQRTRRTVPDR